MAGGSPEDFSSGFRWEQFFREELDWEPGARLNVADLVVDRHARQDPLRTALVLIAPEAEEDERYTYGELRAHTSQFANALRKLGVEKGDRVARLLPRRYENYVTFLGSWRGGAVDVPLYTTFGPEAIAYRVQDSGARVLVTNSENRRKLDHISGGLPGVDVIVVDQGDGRAGSGSDLSFWSELSAASDVFEPAPTKEADLAIVQYTSGTTGLPKGTMITHGSILGLLPFVRYYLDVRDDDVFWAFADPGWTYGLLPTGACIMGLGRTLLVYCGAFDARSWYQIMEHYGVTNFSAAPTAYRTVAAAGEDLAKECSVQVRRFTSAGEYLNPEVSRWFEKQFGVSIADQYGITEAGMLVGNHRSMVGKLGSMGKPIPGFEVAILDDGGKVVPPGRTGLVAVKRHRFMLGQGYWNRPEQWEQCFIGGKWFNSHDLASIDDEGYYYYKGRQDDVISSAGYRIGPTEVEDSLLAHPAVAEAAVVGKSDSYRGDIVKAFVVLKSGFQASEHLGKELQEWVRQQYSKHAYPREVEFIAELPKTESGKVKRRELRG